MKRRNSAWLQVLALVVAPWLAGGCESVTTQENSYSLPSTQSDGTILDSQLKTLGAEVKKYPKRHDLYYQIAGVHFQKSDYNESLAALQHAIELSPSSSRYYYQKGRVFLQMGELDSAEVAFREAVRMTSVDRYTGPHAALGYTLWKRGKLREAAVEFERCVELEPQKDKFHYFLGSVYDVLGEGEKTIRHYLEYLALGGQAYRQRVMFVLRKRGVDTSEIEQRELQDRSMSDGGEPVGATPPLDGDAGVPVPAVER